MSASLPAGLSKMMRSVSAFQRSTKSQLRSAALFSTLTSSSSASSSSFIASQSSFATPTMFAFQWSASKPNQYNFSRHNLSFGSGKVSTRSASTSSNESSENTSTSEESKTGNKGQKSEEDSNEKDGWGKRFYDYYNQRLNDKPYSTQMITSGILGGAADVTTQHLEHGWAEDEGKAPKPWDWRRLAAVTIFGILGMGPMGHVWYVYLEKFTAHFCKTKLSMIVTKVCGDTFLFGPVCLWLFFVTVSLMEGTEWEMIRRKMWRDFVPTYLIDYSFWPLVQGTNFAFIPVRHQLLFVNTVCYFDDIFLTYVQHNELPRIFQLVENWWKNYYQHNLLKPGEDIDYIFFEDEDD